MRVRSLLIPFSLLTLHCSAPDSSTASSTAVAAVDESKSDSAAAVVVRKAGNMTVTVNPLATSRSGAYVLTGTTSKNITDAFSFVPDDAFAQANVTGKRSFEIVAQAGSELNSLLSGLPLLVRLTPASGVPVFLQVTIAPRFVGFSGSTVENVAANIDPVWSGGNVVYRAHDTLKTGYTTLSVEAGADQSNQPFVKLDGAPANVWRVDFQYDQLQASLAAPVTFSAATPSGVLHDKRANLSVQLSNLDITTGDPYQVWTSDCAATVKACAAKQIAKGNLDLASCGTYREVQVCAPAIAPEPTSDVVAADFQTYLATWYATATLHPGDNTLAEAQAAVDANAIVRVTTTYDDPDAHDITLYYIFRHPDVVEPGSDTTWYLAYSKLTGKLVQVYQFN